MYIGETYCFLPSFVHSLVRSFFSISNEKVVKTSSTRTSKLIVIYTISSLFLVEKKEDEKKNVHRWWNYYEIDGVYTMYRHIFGYGYFFLFLVLSTFAFSIFVYNVWRDFWIILAISMIYLFTLKQEMHSKVRGMAWKKTRKNTYKHAVCVIHTFSFSVLQCKAIYCETKEYVSAKKRDTATTVIIATKTMVSNCYNFRNTFSVKHMTWRKARKRQRIER